MLEPFFTPLELCQLDSANIHFFLHDYPVFIIITWATVTMRRMNWPCQCFWEWEQKHSVSSVVTNLRYFKSWVNSEYHYHCEFLQPYIRSKINCYCDLEHAWNRLTKHIIQDWDYVKLKNTVLNYWYIFNDIMYIRKKFSSNTAKMPSKGTICKNVSLVLINMPHTINRMQITVDIMSIYCIAETSTEVSMLTS